jgi:hypothetical protein
VSDSQRQAGFSPEAASNPEAVQEKKQFERELKREVRWKPSPSGLLKKQKYLTVWCVF